MKRLLIVVSTLVTSTVFALDSAADHIGHHDKVYGHAEDLRRQLGMAARFFKRETPMFKAEGAAGAAGGAEGGEGGVSDKCKACVGGAMKWEVEHIVEGVSKYCDDKSLNLDAPIGEEQDAICHQSELGFGGGSEKAKELGCDKKRWFCKFWKDDQKVALGFMVAKARPWEMGFAYCVGHADCEMKPDASPAEMKKMMPMPTFEALTVDASALPEGHDIVKQGGISAQNTQELEVEIAKYRRQLASEEHEWHQDAEYWTEFKRKWKEEHPEHADHEHHHEHHGHVCVKCYKKVFHIVMHHAVEGTKKMCGHTKCPFLQKWCAWAGKNREMAYGMLLAKVEPWKYAIGRCYHPDHHHGPHHGPHHGGFWHHIWGGGHHHHGHHDHHDGPHDDHPHPGMFARVMHFFWGPPGPPPPPAEFMVSEDGKVLPEHPQGPFHPEHHGPGPHHQGPPPEEHPNMRGGDKPPTSLEESITL